MAAATAIGVPKPGGSLDERAESKRDQQSLQAAVIGGKRPDGILDDFELSRF